MKNSILICWFENMIRYSIYVAICIIATSCTKKVEMMEPNIYMDLSMSKGVFIGCEGNFMYGNASLSYYDKSTKTVYNQVFFNTNNFPIGDVLQSTKIIGNKLYLMVNNSGKIYIINKNSMVYESKISGLVSPRYIEFIDNSKAYVTDLYSPSIAVLNTQTNTLEKGILIGYSPVGSPRGTERMVRYDNFVYTASWSFGDKVYKIDTREDIVVDSLTVTEQPNSLVLDSKNRLWVLSDGGYVGNPLGKKNATLTCINLQTFEIEKIFSFDSETVQPNNLTVTAQGDYMYYVYGTYRKEHQNREYRNNIESHSKANNTATYGVYRMSIDDNSLPQEPYISAQERLIYSLGVDPANGDVYLSDAVDYVSKGMIYRYSKDGVKIDEFQSGIIPSSFTFN